LKKRVSYTLFVLVLLLAACERADLGIMPTLAPTHTPVPTQTPTLAPTWTPTVTSTPTPAPTATATPLPTATPLFGPGTPTPETEGWLTQRWTSASPDGEWFAEVVVTLPFVEQEAVSDVARTRLTVTKSDGTVAWTPLDAWSAYGLGFPVPGNFRWTEDDLYLSLRTTPDGCSLYGWEMALLRFDLEEGALSEVVTDLPGAPALSPDRERLAYLEGTELVLRVLETGEERRVGFDPDHQSWEAGNLTWSPGGERLAFAVVQNACTALPERSAIWTVDTEGLVSTLALPAGEQRFRISSWADEETLFLVDAQGQAWRLDLATSDLVAVE
jgi:hypothetical protein